MSNPTPLIDLAILENWFKAAARPSEIEIDTADLGPHLPVSVPMIFDPAANRFVSVRDEIERWRTKPQFKAGTETALTLRAFIDLVNRHKTEDSVVFADARAEKPSLTAIIDYHPKDTGTADNRRQRIGYQFPLSDDWRAWTAQNGQPMLQGDFAAWIEDHIPDLAYPTARELDLFKSLFKAPVADPSQILTVSRGLSIRAEAKVRTAQVLQSGETAIQFEEEHKDSDGKPVIVPGVFVIEVPAFFGGAPARLPVRLRYRLKAGTIVWAFELYRPDHYVTDAVRADIETVRNETGLPVFEGTPA